MGLFIKFEKIGHRFSENRASIRTTYSASPQELENSETQTARNAKRQERKWSGTRNDVISNAFFSNIVINMSEANHPTRKFDAPFMF